MPDRGDHDSSKDRTTSDGEVHEHKITQEEWNAVTERLAEEASRYFKIWPDQRQPGSAK